MMVDKVKITKTYNDGLSWAADWIEGSLKGETDERVIQFGKNMAMSIRASREIDFSCRVCGVQCAIAPDPPERAVCPEHCEDHDYEYMREDCGTFCKYCYAEAPPDYFDID